MKTSLVTVCTLLTVVSSGGGMIHDEIKETGTEGSAAVIHCPYTKGYETYIKYFCKGVYKNCTTLLQTNREDSWRHEGRLSLNDNKEQRLIVATIRDLRMEDTGPYGCGIERIGQDPFTLVRLTVNKAPRPPQTLNSTTGYTSVPSNVSSTVPTTVSTRPTPVMLHEEVKETGTEGSAAVIHCPYTKGYETYIKYFCKGVYTNCTTLLQTNGEDSWRHEGRLSLNDNKEQRLIVVTIRDLRMEDTGPYSCGIERIGPDPFTLVRLTVNKAPQPPQKLNTTTSSTFKSEGSSTAAVTNTTVSSSRQTGPQPSTDSGSLPKAGGSLCGVLLVMIFISGLYCALRSRAPKDGIVSGQSNSVRNTEDVPLYEEIRATDVNNSITTHQCPAEHSRNTSTTDQRHNSHPTSITVYSTVTDVDLDNTLRASHTHPSTDLQNQGPEHQYSEVYFINNPDINPALTNEEPYSPEKEVLYNPIYVL
ncbi:CMRF35-like molecule 8 [Hoplias malabaricus]|uniref:CMRF35-like molecule 8 n=1 Tax=Hoplias malabaricus TaxID=27720 RepID=UPI003462DC29